jgi:hypothetical protein
MAKLFVIPKAPQPKQMDERSTDPRYLEGQRLLVEAMKYLAQTDPRKNRPAITLLSEHFRTRFRMSDKPGIAPPA